MEQAKQLSLFEVPVDLSADTTKRPSELVLQFRGSLMPIVTGQQKKENRYIYPRNWQLYVSGGYYGEPIHYNTLKLINGRQPNAPWLRVEVLGEQLIRYVDDDGNVIEYEQNGIKYDKIGIEYSLGRIIEKHNI